MFYKCSSLQSLPDISKWNTENVTNMNHMFYKCISLQSLPNISKWKTNNVTDMNQMFDGCDKLTSLTIKGNISNIPNKKQMLIKLEKYLNDF